MKIKLLKSVGTRSSIVHMVEGKVSRIAEKIY